MRVAHRGSCASPDAIFGSHSFMRKLVHDVQNAKEQIDIYSEGRSTRKIVYIIVNFDAGLHEYVDMYKSQIDAFLSMKSFADLEITFDIKPPFYTAMS
jgi:hypothetical protein